eukprot:5800212-Pyramimonas_sp.AAC.1
MGDPVICVYFFVCLWAPSRSGRCDRSRRESPRGVGFKPIGRRRRCTNTARPPHSAGGPPPPPPPP